MEYKEYFKAYENYFWQWEDNAEVLAIPGGSTIAYAEMVIEAIEHLTPQGIPSFGALLLIFAATSSMPKDAIAQVIVILKKYVANAPGRWGNFDSVTSPGIAFLYTIAGLPQTYKQGKGRLQLLQAIFANSHNLISAERAKKIIYHYKKGYLQPDFLIVPEKVNPARYGVDLRTLDLLQRKFPNADNIINKIAGLPVADAVVAPEPEVAAEVINRPRDFIDELIENDKTFHAGALVKHIWTGLRIPYHNTLPSAQPLGGVSDLTNKGQFDKLLISEFANDDLVLLSRLANNEALYYNREIPPVTDNLERVILLDVSLKNWGTPKVVGFAAFLAIVKHPKTDIKCSAFAIGNTHQPLQFDNIADVISGLQLVESSLHCAQGLEMFLKEYTRLHKIEVFLVTSPEGLKMPAVQNTISNNGKLFKYIITAGADGDMHLYHNKHNTRSLIQNIRLPLVDLWKRKPVPQPKKETAPRATNYPLLFSNSLPVKKVLKAEDGEVFIVTNGRSVFKLYDKTKRYNEKGWLLVSDKLPGGLDNFAITIVDSQYILLCFKQQTANILLLNLETGEEKNIRFLNYLIRSQYNEFMPAEKSFLYVTSYNYTVIDYERASIISYPASGEHAKLVEAYAADEKKNQETRNQYWPGRNMLLNINTIFINEVGNLVFNIHELSISHQGVIKLDQTKFLKQVIVAERNADGNEFVFGDNSSITINRYGMLILESGNKGIPVIYVPPLIDSSLGIGTADKFAGNQYFNPANDIAKTVSTHIFWREHMERFIYNIQQNEIRR